jgi:hypothetical protein
MQKLPSVFLTVLLVAPLVMADAQTNPASAAEWQFGEFSIQWPDGYARLPNPKVLQFQNATGMVVTVDVVGHKPFDEAGEKKAVQTWTNYAHTEFARIAGRHGAIVIPLKEEHLPSGSTLFSIGCDGDQGGQSHFGLLFLDISLKGHLAQIVVEGPGLAKAHAERFRTLFETAHWNE